MDANERNILHHLGPKHLVSYRRRKYLRVVLEVAFVAVIIMIVQVAVYLAWGR